MLATVEIMSTISELAQESIYGSKEGWIAYGKKRLVQ